MNKSVSLSRNKPESTGQNFNPNMRRSSSTNDNQRGRSRQKDALDSLSEVKIQPKIVKSYAIRTRIGKNGGIDKTN